MNFILCGPAWRNLAKYLMSPFHCKILYSLKVALLSPTPGRNYTIGSRDLVTSEWRHSAPHLGNLSTASAEVAGWKL